MLIFLILSSWQLDHRRGVDVPPILVRYLAVKFIYFFSKTNLLRSSVLSEKKKTKNIQFSYNTKFSAMAILLGEPT